MDSLNPKSPSGIPAIAIWCGFGLLLVLNGLAWWVVGRRSDAPPLVASPSVRHTTEAAAERAKPQSTKIFAHNLRLHQGPDFRVYIQWLRGQLAPAHKGVTPSFDDPESFYLNVTNGVIRANIGDLCNYLNAKSKDAPLRDIKMGGSGNQVKITGTFHKLIALPVELTGVWQPVSGNRVQLHVTKISILKLPFKSLLGGLHLTLASFMKSDAVPGIEVKDNDIYFDPELLMPAPHIRGTLTSVSMMSPDLQAVYGDTTKDVERVEEWRNFLRLENGTLNFGKLTMHDVDLMMVDISQDAWFDLDLANYQAQLVNGYTRMTPQAGLQIFMPDVSDLKADKLKDVSIEWFKNRNAAPPREVQGKK